MGKEYEVRSDVDGEVQGEFGDEGSLGDRFMKTTGGSCSWLAHWRTCFMS